MLQTLLHCYRTLSSDLQLALAFLLSASSTAQARVEGLVTTHGVVLEVVVPVAVVAVVPVAVVVAPAVLAVRRTVLAVLTTVLVVLVTTVRSHRGTHLGVAATVEVAATVVVVVAAATVPEGAATSNSLVRTLTTGGAAVATAVPVGSDFTVFYSPTLRSVYELEVGIWTMTIGLS